jgi:DNA-binding CsgD family transcriptional regulator
LLVAGTNNKLIARSLRISPDTVRFHLKKIYEKFGVSDRRLVADLARERGLLG